MNKVRLKKATHLIALAVLLILFTMQTKADQSPLSLDIKPIPFAEFEKNTEDSKAQAAALQYGVERFPAGSSAQDFVTAFKASGGTCSLDKGLSNMPIPEIIRYVCIVKAGPRWVWPWQWFRQPDISSWQGIAYVKNAIPNKIVKLELTPNFSDF